MVHVRAAQEAAARPEEPEQETSLATTIAGCQGVLLGVLARVVQYRSSMAALLLSGSNAHYRGLAAALVGDARLAVQETKQLWREDGVYLFVKWPALVMAAVMPCGVFAAAVQPLVDQVFGVSEKDIEERTLRLHISRGLTQTLALSLMYPCNILLTCYATHSLPSWKVALLDRVLKGKDHFYASFPSSTLMGMLLLGSDALRAKVLHWHKVTFFPDFMPRGDAEEDIDSEEEEELFEEPSTVRRVAYVASTALVFGAVCTLTAVCSNPFDAVSLRMSCLPHVYGPLGALGTMRAIYRQEGVWGFFHGLVPAVISHCGLGCLAIEDEANTGHFAL